MQHNRILALTCRFAMTVFGMGILGVPSMQMQAADRTRPTHADVRYGPHERNVFDFYQADAKQPTPVAIFIHGGGFRNGSKNGINQRDLQQLLASGISVAAFNYRYVGQAPLPAAHHDCRRALQVLRSRADEWNIDRDRIGAFGGSAGAQICMYLAFHDDMSKPDSDDPIDRESTRLQAVATSGGQTTMNVQWWMGHIPGYDKPHRDFYESLGAETEEDYLKTVRDISALSLITRDDAPIHMSYRMAPDEPVPTGQKAGGWKVHHVQFGVALKRKMDAIGVPADLAYPGAKNDYANKVEFFIASLSPGKHPAEPVTRSTGGRKVVVGTLMFNMFHEYPGLERRLEELGQFIDEMAEQASEEYTGGLDIVALPENAVNGNANGSAEIVSVPLEGAVLEFMGAKAREHNCYIAVPLYLVDDRKNDLYSNAVVLLDRKGRVVGTYRKYFPVASRSRDILEGGVTPGNEFPVFDCDFGRVGIQICFDISFDKGWEALARKGAKLVIWPTQSPGQIKPAFRAMRNNYYVLSSTWRNNASLLDPTGHNIRAITGHDGVFVEQIDLDYVRLMWQSKLKDGKIFTDKYGDRVGFRYSRAEDSGIFWSNDPDKSITEMVQELKLELPTDLLERNQRLHSKLRPSHATTN